MLDADRNSDWVFWVDFFIQDLSGEELFARRVTDCSYCGRSSQFFVPALVVLVPEYSLRCQNPSGKYLFWEKLISIGSGWKSNVFFSTGFSNLASLLIQKVCESRAHRCIDRERNSSNPGAVTRLKPNVEILRHPAIFTGNKAGNFHQCRRRLKRSAFKLKYKTPTKSGHSGSAGIRRQLQQENTGCKMDNNEDQSPLWGRWNKLISQKEHDHQIIPKPAQSSMDFVFC